MNFSKPSKIQERALPLLIANPYVGHRLFVPMNDSFASLQSAEHDRPIAVGDGQDGCLRADDAEPGGLFAEQAPGACAAGGATWR